MLGESSATYKTKSKASLNKSTFRQSQISKSGISQFEDISTVRSPKLFTETNNRVEELIKNLKPEKINLDREKR